MVVNERSGDRSRCEVEKESNAGYSFGDRGDEESVQYAAYNDSNNDDKSPVSWGGSRSTNVAKGGCGDHSGSLGITGTGQTTEAGTETTRRSNEH